VNANEILDMIGDAKGTYLWETQKYRDGTAGAKPLPLPRRRLWLVAAVIGLMLLLVGCTVAYVLRLQDLKVAEYRPTTPTVYDENGDVISLPTLPQRTQITLQGANQEALAEWNSFCRDYDPDGAIVTANDNNELGIPNPYYIPYGCYSWEMVNKLNEIVRKYDLKLLSPDVGCQSYESSVLFSSLGIDGVFHGDVEYLSGYFYPEGTFNIELLFQPDTDQWPYEDNLASYYYSVKEYFDPVYYEVADLENCTQWNYTRSDGRTVLLVMNDEQARIIADLQDALVTVSFASSKWDGGTKVQMTQSALEQISEQFDFSIQPHPADMTKVDALMEAARAAYEAERAAAAENLYTQGYEQYIQQKLEKAAAHSTRTRDGLFYSLCDLNGDGVMELLSGGKASLWEILSMRDGKSYQYADCEKISSLAALQFTVCENHVLELERIRDNSAEIWYYFRAEAEGLTFLEGLEREKGIWYSLPVLPAGDPRAKERTEITEQQAQAIIASYVPLETQPERQQMKRYGEPVKPIPWTDPYAIYIAEALEWLEDAGKLTYTLMDLNGDGIQELIARDTWTIRAGSTEPVYALSVHTIVDGKLVIVQGSHGMTDVCEGGILMYGEEDGTHYEFYRMKGTELELIEMIYQDRIQKYWVRAVEGENPQSSNCSEETARSYIAQYRPIELNMKPFSEYPFS
jgi:hypothetical protein